MDAVADLVAGVLPDLAKEQGVGLFRLCRLPDLFDEGVGQLVGHIQPPAGGAHPQPFADDAVLPAYKLLIAGIGLLHVGQGVHAPPALIAGGMLLSEPVPAVIGAARPGECARFRIIPIFIEIDAVITRMAEYAVQNDPDASGLRVGAQLSEGLLVAEAGVDGHVVCGVVFVVAGGQEYGV